MSAMRNICVLLRVLLVAQEYELARKEIEEDEKRKLLPPPDRNDGDTDDDDEEKSSALTLIPPSVTDLTFKVKKNIYSLQYYLGY